MTEKIKTAKEVETMAVRESIYELLEQCTVDQVSFFFQIHLNAPWQGFKNCPENKLSENYELIRRTVLSNKSKGNE